MKLLSFHSATIAKAWNSILVAIFIALVFVIIDAFQECKVTQLFLNVNMKSSVDSVAQLYYDLGNGLNEKDSTRCRVYRSEGFQVLKFYFPNKPVQYIRFDPINTEGSFSLKEIQLFDKFNRLIRTIDLQTIKPLHQISSIGIEDDILVVKTQVNANDPMLHLDLPYPMFHTMKYNFAAFFDHAHKKFIIVFTLSFAAMLFAFFDRKKCI